MYHVFHCLAIKIKYKKKRKKKRVTAPILKQTYDQKPETLYLNLNIASNFCYSNSNFLISPPPPRPIGTLLFYLRK